MNNVPVASIGTELNTIKSLLNPSTSPDTISLHRELENIKKHKINNVIIEASSHGLHQNRMNHLKLKGIFTNFTQDHLDYHKSMNVYFTVKCFYLKKFYQKTIICDKTIEKFPILKKISKKRHLKMIEIDKIKKKKLSFKFKYFSN